MLCWYTSSQGEESLEGGEQGNALPMWGVAQGVALALPYNVAFSWGTRISYPITRFYALTLCRILMSIM